MIQFGEVPNFAQSASDLGLGDSFNTDINQSITDLANQNTQAGTSTYANLQTAYKNQVRGIKQYLAARGLLSSGETGYRLGNAQQSYNQGLYDDTNKLLSYLSGIQSSYNTAQQNEEQQQTSAANDAYSRAITAAQSGQALPPSNPNATDNSGPATSPNANSAMAQAIQRAIAGAALPAASNLHYGGMQL